MELVFQEGKNCVERMISWRPLPYLSDTNLQPDHQTSLYNRAKAKTKKSMLDEALLDYNKLIDLSPSNAEYFSDRGILYFHLKDSNNAIANLDEACTLEPNKAIYFKPFNTISTFLLKKSLEGIMR